MRASRILQTDRNLLQGVPRGNLRVAALVHELPCSESRARTRCGALHPKPVEPRLIDRLERQDMLEPRIRRRVELAGRLERAVPIEAGTIALEAEGAAPSFEQRGQRLLPACWTENFWSSALELAAGKRCPIVVGLLGE